MQLNDRSIHQETTSKLADTVKAISVSEEKFSLACKGKTVPFSIEGFRLTCTHTIFAESYDIHVDLKTFNETISNEQHIISQLMVDADSEGIVGANVRMSEKIIDDIRSLQQNTALNERVLAQVQSSTEDCVAEVSQLQLLLNAINDQIGMFLDLLYCVVNYNRLQYRSSSAPINKFKHTFR